jgi:hypothetical protein
MDQSAGKCIEGRTVELQIQVMEVGAQSGREMREMV